MLNADNPYNIEFIVDEANFDVTNGQPVRLDAIVVDTDIIRVIEMVCDVEAGWGDECRETVDEFFHPQNLTFAVRNALGMKLQK